MCDFGLSGASSYGVWLVAFESLLAGSEILSMDADALFIKLRSDWQCVNGFCEKVVANVVKVMLLDFDA